MKIFKMLAVLAVAIMACSACNLKAAETNSAAPPASQIPDDTIVFSNVDTSQVLEIYAKLTGVVIKKSQPIPLAIINFKTTKPLTRAEAIQALEKVLREQAGVVFKPLDTNYVEVTYDESVKLKN
jgi:hypothetical protein